MPRAAERDETPVDEDDLDDELLAEIERHSRGKFEKDGKTYWRVRREFALVLRGDDRIVSIPRASDPYGRGSHYAEKTGAYAGWSGEKRDGRFRRFPVLRLDVHRFTVIDIDTQRFPDTIIPPNALAIVETGRGIQVILPGKPRTWYDHPLWSMQDQNYIARSRKRGTWNLRVYDKGERGAGRIISRLGGQSREDMKATEDVMAPWLSMGGRLRGYGGEVYGGKPAKGSKVR